MKKTKKMVLALLLLNSAWVQAAVHDGVASCKVDGQDVDLVATAAMSGEQFVFEAKLDDGSKVAATITEPRQGMLLHHLSLQNNGVTVSQATALLPDPATSRHDVFSRLSTLMLTTSTDSLKKVECEFRLQRALQVWQR